MKFVGRKRELAELSRLLERVKRGQGTDPGIAVLLRGRRRVGKSRLVSELVERAGLPAMYFQAARWAERADELAMFADAIASSTLPNAQVAQGNSPSSLTAALMLLAAALPDDSPTIVVIDEVPWLLEGMPGGAGELQRVWDRTLSRKPVLLLLLGSDLAMMEALTAPDQPFHGRPTEMVLDTLTPSDVADITGLSAFNAFDAYLITGGQPLVALEWAKGMSRDEFLRESFSASTSGLVVSGTRVLDAEFPEGSNARAILTAIGGRGERTFTTIRGRVAGGSLSTNTLSGNLATLVEKRVVAADEPLSIKAAHKDRRWRVADPALRFWLAFVEPALGEVDRGKPDLAMERVAVGFESWRGRAIEPVVRAGLERLLPDGTWPDARAIGGWWPRSNTPEIDLVATDRQPGRVVSFVGSIKWRAGGSISRQEVSVLAEQAIKVPGASAATPLVAVVGAKKPTDPRLTQTWTAAELLAASD